VLFRESLLSKFRQPGVDSLNVSVDEISDCANRAATRTTSAVSDLDISAQPTRSTGATGRDSRSRVSGRRSTKHGGSNAGCWRIAGCSGLKEHCEGLTHGIASDEKAVLGNGGMSSREEKRI
jgi:hypothetical protein